MLDLELSDEQRMLERSVREWGAREVAPRIRELDRKHQFDPNILTQMASLGLLGICISPEAVTFSLISEAILEVFFTFKLA